MKAMILAAGLGKRMRPLTNHTPKPLLRVGGSYLIEYHIRRLQEVGITYLVINHSYLGGQIEAALGNGSQYGVCIQYSPEPERLETGGGIYRALQWLGDDPFLVVNGDIWTDYPFEHLIKTIPGHAHLVLIDNPKHNTQGDFAIESGYLHSSGDRRYTYSGIGVYQTQLFQGCQAGAFPLAPLLIKSMGQQQITGELYHGKWVDVGTPDRLQTLDQALSG